MEKFFKKNRNKRKENYFVCGIFVSAMIIVFVFTACLHPTDDSTDKTHGNTTGNTNDNTTDDSSGNTSGNTSGNSSGDTSVMFTDINKLEDYLSDLDDNTAADAYTVKLVLRDNLGGDVNTSGSVGYVLSENNTKFVSLDLSDSTFNSIEDYAFYGCKNLIGIILPSGVTSIGDHSFDGCTDLASITIPSGVTSIGSHAFNRCTSLTGVNIPNSVTSIGNSAFQSCAKITSITIPSSVTSIEDSAFNRTGLTSVTIPSSVKSIGNWSFGNNPDLVSVTFQGTIPADDFYSMGSFFGDLRAKFYATNSDDGTPGTYTTTAPASASSVWTKK